jgi:hypothetical protein
MYGLLVYGDNHFIVNGPEPPAEMARALVMEWAHPMLGRAPDARLAGWSIRTKAFREELAWAVVVHSDEPYGAAVSQLLAELRERGLPIRKA